MTNLQTNQPPLQPKTNSKAMNWPQLLWREWRHCDDQEYAAYLYDFLINEPLSRSAALMMILATCLTTATLGLFLAILFSPKNGGSSFLLQGFLGGAVVAMILFLLRPKRGLSWGGWLQVFTPQHSLKALRPGKTGEVLWWVWLAGLTSGLGVGWTGAILFDQPRPAVLSMATIAAVGIAIFLFIRTDSWGKIGLIGASLLGLLFGLNFGVGFAQLVGLTFGTLDVITSSRMVGLSVGFVVGLLLGRQTGLVGTLLYLAFVALMLFISGPRETLLAWLVGMVSGGLIGSFSYLWLPSSLPPSFDQIYPYRLAFLWWFSRPLASQVEAALVTLGGQGALLRHLAKQRHQGKPPNYYITRLAGADWRDRFVARHVLVSLGTASFPELEQVLHPPKPANSLKQTSAWLVRSIGWDTSQQLAHQAGQLRCIRCLTSCTAHQAKFVTPPVIYYGCRTCQQSSEFFQTPAGVVAVLDHHWNEAHHAEAGLLRVNALAWPGLFDFDRVEIIRATDEAVERFAVQAGNDTDPVRRGHYPEMVCRIDPECDLSENTKRILERIFGEVEMVPLQKPIADSPAKLNLEVDRRG